MIKQVLLPLDGSPIAARVGAYLEQLLEAAQEVKLLVVVEPRHPVLELGGSAARDEELRERLRAAQADLQRYQERLAEADVPATGDVLVGDPPALILTQASLNEPTLVAMATHGVGGLARWTRGSVAERVLEQCAVPLLLIPASSLSPGSKLACRRIVVPLDGSDRAAAVLPLVADLARIHAAEVVLLRVRVASAAASDLGNPSWAVPVAQIDEEAAQARIEGLRGGLERQGVSARTLVVTDTNAARGILDAVDGEQADLLALTTHGRTGMDKYLFGSVAQKVVRRCQIPFLVQRVPGRVPAPASGA